MNIPIPKEMTPEGKYTIEAQKEIRKQVKNFVGKICEEAERMETSSTKDVNQVQITPRTIQRAVNYVIEVRVEKRKYPIFIEYVRPSIKGSIAVFLGVLQYFSFTYELIIVISSVALYMIFLVITLTYKLR
ncbi:MAG: hypothetical protein IKA83_09210 [Paludibacteraceae bacterium]|nr:hypothetical protein [Paludibacteraceae bacterium]